MEKFHYCISITIQHVTKNFAHAITAQLSCCVQNFVVIALLEFGEEKMKLPQIWIVMKKMLVKWTPQEPNNLTN